MTAELVLSALYESDDTSGDVLALAVTDQMIVATGRAADRAAVVLASADARHFAVRSRPRAVIRDLLAVGDSLWACGDSGLLSVSRDHGAQWQEIETGTAGSLHALALGGDGAIWVVGEAGYAARVLGDTPRRIEVGAVALRRVCAVRDEVVLLGSDGTLLRWRDGKVAAVACGAPGRLSAVTVTARGTWVVVGEAGFVARSPDGDWYARVDARAEGDLEAISVLPDGMLVAVGDRGQVLTSADDARTWRGVTHDGPGAAGAHLWSIARFGGGALIGGERQILRLAPPDDATWGERASASGAVGPLERGSRENQDDGRERGALEDAFAAGPEGFIAGGLATYLAATEAPGRRLDARVGHEPERDEPDGPDDDNDHSDHGIDDPEALALLGEPGDADAFRRNHGVDLPVAARRLLELAGERDPSPFAELRLDAGLRPDVGDHNLFELMVRRNQQAYLGSDLVEAFCGVFEIGSQDDGDTYHLEVVACDGEHQVLHYDRENAAFSGVCADSLDSLVYLAALVKAGETRAISETVYAAGLRKLHGKVAPPWQFAIGDKAAGFVPLEPRRRDTEFFFYRSRWICALLRNDGVTQIADIPSLFDPGLNEVVAPDQLQARFEACGRYIPTALYAMWRAYLFDEPELAHYLEIGRQHAARLVRDAARLVDELRAGRNALGTIKHVRAWLAAFRALNLDPRGAAQRRAETALRATADAARRAERAAELERTPLERWSEAAWQWLDDGAAHRALLARLDRAQRAQIAAIDELRDASEDERAIAIPRLAAELSPELEAVLVGSLVRGDDLKGVLVKPSAVLGEGERGGHGDDHDGDADQESSGWAAIDRALASIYRDAEPLHYGTVIPYGVGGDDPIPGISAYARRDPSPHWHFITYGFTELFRRSSEAPDESGYGFELTLRLARGADEPQPPSWALNFLQNLARYVFTTGNAFAAGHKMGLNGPIALDHSTKITAVCFTDDPELGDIASPLGKARFVQVVGITDDEYRVIQEWSTGGLVEILQERIPFLLTDLARDSVLDDPATAALVRERIDREGSSEDLTFAGELTFSVAGGDLAIELGSLYAATLPRAMRGRIRHRRAYELRGRDAALRIEPGDAPSFRVVGMELVLTLTQELAAEIEVALHDALAGTYRFAIWPELTIVVTPSIIRGQDGSATDVRGVVDPGEVRRILDEDRARRAAIADDDGDGARVTADRAAVSTQDVTADADADADADEGTVDPGRIAAALAMIERGVRRLPGDPDLQLTHARLLIQAERAGDRARSDELLAVLARCAQEVRMRVAIGMAEAAHPRFGEAIDLVLDPEVDPGSGPDLGDVSRALLEEVGEAILDRSPPRFGKLLSRLPDDAQLLSALAQHALEVHQRDAAIVLYDRLLALPLPEGGAGRAEHLRALNNACILTHAAGAFDTALRIAERARPVAHENPQLHHSAACAYAAVNDHARAFEQVKLAFEHGYEHLARLESDPDLGPLLDWPEFKALFEGWRARREGN